MSSAILSRCSARQLSSSSTATTRRPLAAQPLRRQQRQQRQGRVLAAAQPGNKEETQTVLQDQMRLMLQKYDFLSAGLGALAVTTFCVARGQDPVTALWITGASTVVALLLNEMLFNDESHH